MKYRADIDGLRAIAVLLVILFHYGVTTLSGGFIGVDIFFVLSGYLISSIIFNKLDKRSFSFSNFYFRRIRRLFPVYVVVILLTSIAAYQLMLPQDFREYGQSLFASTIYASNILFFLEAGYFDTASHLKPLLHTWSLSVEEQFYLVFPVVAWITYKFSRQVVIGVFVFLTLVSFGLSVYVIDIDQSAVFYLYPFRAWEMFLGTLLALNVVPNVKNTIANTLMSVLGLLLIFIAAFQFDNTTSFPGATALLPCIGTVLLIHAGAHGQNLIHRLLASPIPVFIGKLSYSLYLWHWPVYVLYVYSIPHEMGLVERILMTVAIFILSFISWKFVETPFREGKIHFTDSAKNLFAATAVVSMLFLGAGFYISKTNGMPSRLTETEQQYAHAASDLFGNIKGCKRFDNSRYPNIANCVVGNPQTANSYTLVWGDSHVGALKLGIEKALNSTEKNILMAWAGGCPPLLNLHKDESVASNIVDEKCVTHNNAVRDLILSDINKINAVVLIGRWSYYTNGGGVGIDKHNRVSLSRTDGRTANGNEAVFQTTFADTIDFLNRHNLKVFVVEQPPEFHNFNARKYAIDLINKRQAGANTTLTLDELNSRQEIALKTITTTVNNGFAELLSTHHFFCDDKHCTVLVNNRPSYFDNNHLTSAGAQQISTMFSPLVEYLLKVKP